MGIKKLNKYLKEAEDAIFIHKNLSAFCNSIDRNGPKIVLAIDTSLYIYKYMYSYPNFLLGFTLQITRFIKNNIIPLYVFEGTPPLEKQDVLRMRTEKKKRIREKIQCLEEELNNAKSNSQKVNLNKEITRLNKQIIHVTKDDITKLKELFDLFNIQYINAIGESDSMCSFLYKKNIIDACLSDDMDILVSGCSNMIKFNNGEIVHYQLENILHVLNLNYEKFVEMCVLFGCDYSKPVPKLDNQLIYDLIKQDLSLIEIVDYINNKHIQQKIDALKVDNPDLTEEELASNYRSYEDYLNAKKIFMYSHLNESIENFELKDQDSIINKLKVNEFYERNISDRNKKIHDLIYRINYYIDNINDKIKKNII
ncbi:XPG I-region [seawater metagenome]|uniref:XPG I-region n=1 Tax=seawater metagenome TaxID=1561972 RepID=A0A5E8CLM9_9ZZZZ